MPRDGAERYDEVVGALIAEPGVTPPPGGNRFGRSALRVDGRILTRFVHGSMAVKLPRERVDELERAGAGTRLTATNGTPMAEWLALDPTGDDDWIALAREALAFAR